MIYRIASVLIVPLTLSACAGRNLPDPRSGALSLAKECSTYTGKAGDICTVTASNLAEIGVGTRIRYATAAVGSDLDTDVVLDPPGDGNDTVSGHCKLSLATGIGACTLLGGTGRFTSFRANVAVSQVSGPNYAWVGTYSYER